MAENIVHIQNTEALDEIIVGRVEPHIYAFSTNTIPNYLKVGDTYRSVDVRLDEWRKHYPELQKEYSEEAKVSQYAYFRDYSVHDYLSSSLGKKRLERSDIDESIYYSREFFKDTSKEDVEKAVNDIKYNFEKGTGKYIYYNANDNLPAKYQYNSTGTWVLRENQKEVVENFTRATDNGRTNLLMYAVMRFGKTFTSLMCAKEMEANLVLVVSGKAEVSEEWKKACQQPENFKEYTFCDSNDLNDNHNLISDCKVKGEKLIIFLTLQDLQGEEIKEKHKELFENSIIDLLIIDETHFAARAPVYGRVLKKNNSNFRYENIKGPSEYNKEEGSVEELSEHVKKLQAKITLHLSGTPYRIIMSNEFQPEDIICRCQFSDIVDAQKEWDTKNFEKEENEQEAEWENPYYGFPQMIRFAFHPSKSAKEKLKELREKGSLYAFSDLLEPKSKVKDPGRLYKKFTNEKEVLELFQVIDGSKEDENVLGFLDYNRIKEGSMCRHIVCVLPYCASCDALEELILTNKDKFKNLCEYEILNISGVDIKKEYKCVKDIQNKITECENKDQKTLTLTVNRMLTGNTVKEWDTMIYLKDTSSPQEYDQAIFRLQNPYVKEIPSNEDTSKFIKRNMKPQTLLVDFDPYRVFTLQEQKAQIENIIDNKGGNSQAEEKIKKELEISPIFTINENRIEQITPNNIMDYVSQYSKEKSVMEETLEIPVDFNLMNYSFICDMISKQAEIGSSRGLSVEAVEGEGNSEYDFLDDNTFDVKATSEGQTASDALSESSQEGEENTIKDETKIFEDKFRTYYARILFYSFLVEDSVSSLKDILSTMENEKNIELAQNLDLDSEFLKMVNDRIDKFILSQLDYKIKNINMLSRDESLDPLTRVNNAMVSFNRLSESEVVTPKDVSYKMVHFLPDDELIKICEKHGKILDIAGKVGEFAAAIYERLTNKDGLHQDHEIVKDLIYTIPTSKIAYEFTKKIYKILGLNLENIATFTSYDSLDLEKNTFFKQEGEDMKFDFIIGNPPYQNETIGDNKTFAPPIYNKFLENAYQVSDRVEMIHPARFLFDAGNTPKKWNEKMLKDPHLKVLGYEPDSKKVFSKTEIKGGIAVTYHDKNKEFGAIGIYTPYDELKSILNKVINHSDFTTLEKIVFSRTAYRLTNKMHQDHPEAISQVSKGHAYDMSTNILQILPQIFFNQKPDDDHKYVQILGRERQNRVYKYVRRDYINNVRNLNKYKIFLPSANGDGTFGETLSMPIIEGPAVGSTETFISIGFFETKREAKAALKYIKSKFVRSLLGVLKVTQHLTPETWKYVPLQDFTSSSDIDWTQTVSEIDQQLYSKYGLSDNEVTFIESHVKKMN